LYSYPPANCTGSLPNFTSRASHAQRQRGPESSPIVGDVHSDVPMDHFSGSE
jgi:hypothetical protein